MERAQRRYSPELKQRIVEEVEAGHLSLREAAREVQASVTIIQKWLDEFGRYKPMLERSTLSGSTSNEFSGRPLITGLSDPPIGRLTEYMIFDRVRRALEKLAVRRLMQQGAPTLDAFDWDRFKLPPPPEEDSSPLLWLLAAAGVVGGAVAWKRRKRKA